MRTIIFFIICLILAGSPTLVAQVVDDFSDGDFTHNPRWEGDSLHFEVNSAKQLHLKWTGSDTSFLGTQNSWLHEAEWNFWVKLSFNTSANNFLRVYLTSDRMELDQPLNGYLLQVGGSSDSIWFLKQTGTEIHPLFRFPDVTTSQSTNVVRVKITRDATGLWRAWTDPAGGENFTEQGAWFDNTILSTSWFGFWCKYTSSNASKCYMDDIYVGPVIRDTIPPSLGSLKLPDSLHIQLLFSEALDLTEAQNSSNYTLLGSMAHPVDATVPSGQPNEVLLGFEHPFPEQVTGTLKIVGLTDLSGNRMNDTLVVFAWFEPHAFDILIHEVMMDPEPAVGLPPVEYVELYNRTEFPVDLTGWVFDFGSNRKTFPAVSIAANGYLLLACDSILAGFGPSIPLFTSGSSLSNDGASLVLRNSRLQVIHTVTYVPGWIGESWKKDGGWSLEMVDPDNPCGCDGNWRSSQHPFGGTPGAINSVNRTNPDLVSPEVLRSFFMDDHTWEVRFSESLDSITLVDPSAWCLEPGGTHPETLAPVSPTYRSVRFTFAEPFSPGFIYTLSGSPAITDCAGNAAETPLVSQAAIPASVERNDVIVNEVLHDPYPGASRFIELFNRSNKVVDLKELAFLVSDTGSSAGTTGANLLTGESYLMFPLDFVAVCTHEKTVKQHYQTPNPKQFLEMASFPSMKNESGSISLIRSWDEELIDGMVYHNGMHYPLLTSVEGVSLERISPERPATDPSNWHTAGENTGYATPAYENSQWLDPGATEDVITIHPPVFSPDNDGHDDVVSIGLTLDGTGFQVTIMIYDAAGRRIRQLVSNALIGPQDEFFWDGIRDDRTKASMGIYVVYIELLHPTGVVKKFRKSLVVGGTL
ncbi:MAG: lamin tail domain-containing protein [Bacteroidales bacterium]|nr:lamin tail domain-containing protein [Bacteroidales bacterium]